MLKLYKEYFYSFETSEQSIKLCPRIFRRYTHTGICKSRATGRAGHGGGIPGPQLRLGAPDLRNSLLLAAVYKSVLFLWSSLHCMITEKVCVRPEPISCENLLRPQPLFRPPHYNKPHIKASRK